MVNTLEVDYNLLYSLYVDLQFKEQSAAKELSKMNNAEKEYKLKIKKLTEDVSIANAHGGVTSLLKKYKDKRAELIKLKKSKSASSAYVRPASNMLPRGISSGGSLKANHKLLSEAYISLRKTADTAIANFEESKIRISDVDLMLAEAGGVSSVLSYEGEHLYTFSSLIKTTHNSNPHRSYIYLNQSAVGGLVFLDEHRGVSMSACKYSDSLPPASKVISVVAKLGLKKLLKQGGEIHPSDLSLAKYAKANKKEALEFISQTEYDVLSESLLKGVEDG